MNEQGVKVEVANPGAFAGPEPLNVITAAIYEQQSGCTFWIRVQWRFRSWPEHPKRAVIFENCWTAGEFLAVPTQDCGLTNAVLLLATPRLKLADKIGNEFLVGW